MECFRRIGQPQMRTSVKLNENALGMNDYDNRVPTHEAFPNVPFDQQLNLQGRLLEASVVYGLQPEQIETAAHITLGREIEYD
eukprot:2361870-Amphidinium_carterae.1